MSITFVLYGYYVACKRMLSSFLGTPILLQSLHVIPVVIFTNTISLHILITHYLPFYSCDCYGLL